MTILEALEEVNSNLTTPAEFIYADMNEANFAADSVDSSSLPVLIILPITVTDNRTPNGSGVLKSTLELNAMFLTQITDVTTDYSAATVETSAIEPMRTLARQFIFRLNEHDIIDPESNGIVQVTYQPTYSSLDANLFGVLVRAQVPVMEGITGCDH